MATPRSVSSRRAALSYDQLKNLVPWPDLVIKDYQGIGQDTRFLADEIDDLEIRVIVNEEDIVQLKQDVIDLNIRVDNVELRLDALEARIFRTVIVTESVIAMPFQVVLCDNVAPIEVTLFTGAVKDDQIHVMRRNDEVTSLGLIDGDNTGRIFNVKYQSELYIFDGTGWSAI